MTQKRLYRSRTDRKIAGVCGGIAENAGVDPVFIRLAAVGLALLAPPVGLIGYLACWIVVPERGAVEMAGGGAAAGAAYGAGGAAYADAAAPGDIVPPGDAAGSTPYEAPAGAAPDAAAPSGAAGGGAGPGPTPVWTNIDGSLLGGALFVGVGLFFLLINLGILDWEMFRFWRWRFVWPLVVIVLGVLMLVRGLRSHNLWSPR